MRVMDKHWLAFGSDRQIVGCHCGFKAEDSDCGWGDSVVQHIVDVSGGS